MKDNVVHRIPVILWAVIGVFQLLVSTLFQPDLFAFLSEVLFLAGFVGPLFFWRQDLSQSVFPFEAKTIRVVVLCISGFTLFFLNRFIYQNIRFGADKLDFLMLFGVAIAGFFSGFLSKESWLERVCIVISFIAFSLTGRREWIFIFLLSFSASVIMIYGAKRAVIGLFGLALLFGLILAPITVVYRTSNEIENYTVSEMKTDFFSNIKRMPIRLSQSKITAGIVFRKADSIGFKGVRTFFQEQLTLLVPRFFNPEKPSFRPGEVIYTTFIHPENPKRYSYPCSISGEAFWYFGLSSMLLVPLIAFVWSFGVLKSFEFLPVWIAVPFAIVALNTEIHLLFLFTTLLRFLVLVCGISALVWVIRRFA